VVALSETGEIQSYRAYPGTDTHHTQVGIGCRW